MTPTASRYLEKAERAIRAAETLMASDSSEFALGRSYYAMFYTAQALLHEKGLELRRHGTVHSAFGEHYVKTGLLDAKFHRWLLNAYDARILGDYEAGAETSGNNAASEVEHAREFLAAARQLLEKRA